MIVKDCCRIVERL